MCIEILYSFDDAVRLYVVNEVLQRVHRLGRDVMKGYRVITHPFVALQRNIHNIFINPLTSRPGSRYTGVGVLFFVI